MFFNKFSKLFLLKISFLLNVFLLSLSPMFAQANLLSQPRTIEPPRLIFDNEAERENRFWEMIKRSNDENEFYLYLNEFPQGKFANLARLKIQELQNTKIIASNTEQEKLAEANIRIKLENTKEAREHLYNNFFYPNYRMTATPEQRKVAYEAALNYLYNFETDEDEIVKYLRKWIARQSDCLCEHPKYSLALKFNNSVKAGNVAEIFATGKSILDLRPDYLNVLFYMAEYGYLNAHNKRIDSFNDETIFYAKQAIDKIKAGQVSPENNWQPTENKEHALSWMNYIVGYIYHFRMNDKKSAAPYFYETIRHKYKLSDDSDSYNSRSNLYSRHEPHILLGNWYLDQYNQAVIVYNRQKDSSKIDDTRKNELTNSWKKFADLALNVYVHSYTKTKNTEVKNEIKNTINQLYKYRYNESSGFDAFILIESRKPLIEFNFSNH